MTTHKTATWDAWLEARRDLLAAEKDLTRRSDQVAQLRRQLPWVRVDKAYTFDGPDGRQTLAGLFNGRRQLMVQHFMLTPGAEQGCPSCSFMADHTDGITVHLVASRRHVRGHLVRAIRRDRAFSPTHGLAVQVAVLARQQLQL